MITFKDNCRLKTLSPTLYWILHCLYSVDEFALTNQPQEIVITSVNDSTHSPDSRHYKDEAIDVRSHNFQTDKAKADFINHLLGHLNSNNDQPNRFEILFEDKGGPNEHFHIQPRKGLTFSSRQII